MPRSTLRIGFTDEHDVYLAKYLAKYSPTKDNRSGNILFQNLVANRENLWPWSVHHTWQSWRQRYVKHQYFFDVRIAKYQARDATAQKRKSPDGSVSGDTPAPKVKRAKLGANKEREQEDKGEGPSGRGYANTKPKSSKPREPDVQPLTPRRPGANADQDIPERPSAPRARKVAPMDDRPPPVKQLKKRAREPSEAFASEASSPTKALDSSQTRVAPVSTYPRAPPRFVNSFDGQVLVDQKGRVPRTFPLENGEEEEEEEESEVEIIEETAHWPPVRHQAAKQKKVNELDVDHRAYSRLQAPLPLEEDADGHPLEKGRHAVVAQFIADVREHSEDVVQDIVSPVEHTALPAPEPHASPTAEPPSEISPEEDTDGERRHPFEVDTYDDVAQFMDDAPLKNEHQEHAVANGMSSVKRTVPLGAGSTPKSPKFTAPLPSAASPFGPESLVKARPLQPSQWKKAARHPALTRIQRQGKEEGHPPSIDFVALSRSSASAQSSRSSRASVRPARWSLPGFPRVPWVDEHGASSAPGSAMGSRSGSGSGVASPFRWRMPAYGEWERDRRASIAFTPSPARSVTADGAAHSPALSRVTLHPTDVDLVCSHGLASFLTHMAANHGLALSVVEEVYGRLGSLAAADEVLKGMREAAQGFGEREIERRLRGKADEEEEEYSPPETSRAARWKRQEMQRAEEEEDLAQALVEHLPAQALQRRLGQAQFRREIVKRFV